MAYNQLIHCDNCGEDYAATYRRCPFCDRKPARKKAAVPDEPAYRPEEDYDPSEYEQGYEEREPRRQGGRRLAHPGPKGPNWGRIILYTLSTLVIIAAIVILIWKVAPMLSKKPQPTPEPAPSDAVAAQPTPEPAPAPAPTPTPEPTPDPALELPEPDPVPSDTPAPSEPPAAEVKPRLNYTDFSITAKYPDPVRLTVKNGEAESWKSSNEKVAAVSEKGLVSAKGNGYALITCTLADGSKLTCDVHVSGFSADAAPAETEKPAQSEEPSQSDRKASLSLTDFSITSRYPEPVRLTVKNGEAASWKSSNESVATVSSNGTVTGEGNGIAYITCTLTDGTRLTCQVNVSGK